MEVSIHNKNLVLIWKQDILAKDNICETKQIINLLDPLLQWSSYSNWALAEVLSKAVSEVKHNKTASGIVSHSEEKVDKGSTHILRQN